VVCLSLSVYASPLSVLSVCVVFFFFFQAEDGIRDFHVTGVQTCALPIFAGAVCRRFGAGATRYVRGASTVNVAAPSTKYTPAATRARIFCARAPAAKR